MKNVRQPVDGVGAEVVRNVYPPRCKRGVVRVLCEVQPIHEEGNRVCLRREESGVGYPSGVGVEGQSREAVEQVRR